MSFRSTAWRRATVLGEVKSSSQKRCSSSSSKGYPKAASVATQNFGVASPKEDISKDYLKEHYASISKKAQQKRSQDRVSHGPP